MADRRSSFPFRFWQSTSTANRRTSSTQGSAPPPFNTNSPRSSTTPPAADRSSAGRTTAPRAETRPAGNSNNLPPANTNTPPRSSTTPAVERSSAGEIPTPTPTPTPKTPPKAEIRPAENVNNPTPTNPSPSETRSSAENENNQTPKTPSTAETQLTRQTNTTTPTANTNTPLRSSTTPAVERSSAGETPTPTPTAAPKTPPKAEIRPAENVNNPMPTNPSPSEARSSAENENNQTPKTPSTAETQSTGQTNTTTPTANTNTQQSTTPTPTTPSVAENENNKTPTTPSTSETQPTGQPNTMTTTPTNPHTTETQPAEKANTHSSTTQVTDEDQNQTPGQSNRMPPSSEPQKASQLISTSSPTRAIGQSRSPPHPSSPSRAVPPSRATTSSPSRMSSVSQKASRSPKLTSSPSTKGVKPNITTSTKLRQKSKEISHPLSNSNGEASESSASEQEPLEDQRRTNIKSDTVDGEDNALITSNTKPEETKEVKEVIQETKRTANDQTNKKVDDAKSEQMHEETQGPLGKKETLSTSHFNGKLPRTNSRPGNKSTSVPTQKASTQSSGEQVPFHKEIRDDISTFVNRMAIGDPKSALNDRPVSVITLAGENRGASLQLGTDSSKGEGEVHIHRGYKINPDKTPQETTNGDESLNSKNSKDAEGKEDQPTEAYVNNNTQGINNSIVFSSSLTERDPGVHMILTRAPSKEPTKSTDEKRQVEMQKAEVKMTPSQKLTYEPTVRRRCLRGLLMESSDSDPGNPEKPRRHGCRVGCNERKINGL